MATISDKFKIYNITLDGAADQWKSRVKEFIADLNNKDSVDNKQLKLNSIIADFLFENNRSIVSYITKGIERNKSKNTKNAEITAYSYADNNITPLNVNLGAPDFNDKNPDITSLKSKMFGTAYEVFTELDDSLISETKLKLPFSCNVTLFNPQTDPVKYSIKFEYELIEIDLKEPSTNESVLSILNNIILEADDNKQSITLYDNYINGEYEPSSELKFILSTDRKTSELAVRTVGVQDDSPVSRMGNFDIVWI